MRALVPLMLVAAIALAPAAAQACEPEQEPWDVLLGARGTMLYVGHDDSGSFWIYEETNGVTGLQREDARCLPATGSDRRVV